MDEDGAIDLAILRETEVLGTRDARSLEVATLMGAKYATFSGDDALGLLLESARHTPTASMSASGVINVHVSTESYVTPNSARRLDVVVDILGRLAQRSEVSQINLIVAFGDERISERDVATQTAAMIGGMTELRRASVDVVDITRRLLSGESVLPAAQFCVSSSYHVALSSIVAEVPTVLMWSGDYYREKAEGLAELFDLPPELLLDDRSDPASAIERCLAIDHSEEERARYAACIRDGIIRSLSGRIEVDRALAQQILALEGGAGWEQVARLSSEYGAAVREVADLRLRVAELTRARRALAGTLD
jgi:polysaccharide pyruvyl transferase WcaK-like protein